MATMTINPTPYKTYSGSGNYSIAEPDNLDAFEIMNDGSADLTFTIQGNSFTVKSGETFYNEFNNFDSFSITATEPWRAVSYIKRG